jgi:2-polyprenyl-3-methyl-5-hydroxy-6-metoxy-1,4-benzoquinol methylase
MSLSLYEKLTGKFQVNSDIKPWKEAPELLDLSLQNQNAHYRLWMQEVRRAVKLPHEFLLPRIEVNCVNELPASMQTAEERFKQAPEKAREISQLKWGYYYYLGGGLSTLTGEPEVVVKRGRTTSIARMQAINGTVDAIAGEEKTDMSLLDFASNWGGMAIDAGLRGFKTAFGFDFKADNVERATALRDYMQASNVSFDVANVYDLPSSDQQQYDIVYNLGLLYHVTDPVRLAQITYQLTRRMAVFDTLTHREPFAGYIQGFVPDPRFKRSGMGEQTTELHPTYRALIALIKFAGFRDLVEIVPHLSEDFPERDRNAYHNRVRRIILAFK